MTPRRFLWSLAALLAMSAPAAAQQDAAETGMKHVGKVHDRLRAAKQREAVSLTRDFDEAGQRYTAAKRSIAAATGITYALDEAFIGQWGAPNGGYGAVQALLTPAVQWKAFDNAAIGTGSFQFYYIAAQYWSGANGLTKQTRLNLNSPINDYPFNDLVFAQASYTQAFPGDWLAVTAGQFPIANFDGNAYANNQQVNFLGYSLAQNGSQNYAQGSLGAYLQLNPNRDVTFAGGFQDANNVAGNYIQFSTLGAGQYAWFLYGAWTPTLGGLGKGSYALMYYNLPSVPAQPLKSDGLSFSASQALDERWALFLRANTAWGSSWAIQTSVAGGAVLNNPLGRNPLDQIGLGVAWNQTNLNLYSGVYARPSETMLELYWATTIGARLQITPDVQLYFQPALTPHTGMAAVFTIRAALLL